MANDETVKKIFSNNLKRYMKDRGITQSQLAQACGVSQQSVSNWLHEKQIPRMGVIERLASYFNILKSDLLEDKSESTTTSQFGDHDANVEYLQNDPDLLAKYLDLVSHDQVGVLFDKVGKLTPKQLKAVLAVIDAIDKEEE